MPPIKDVHKMVEYVQGSSNYHLASQLLQKSIFILTHRYSNLHNAVGHLPLIGAASLASLTLCPATAVMSQP